MTEIERLKHLKLALRIVGIIAIFGFYPLTVFCRPGTPGSWTVGISRNDHRHLRDLGCLSTHCLS